jgi:hypothetical protein
MSEEVYENGLCATDKRSAITGGKACRPNRSREAVKRPGYTGLAPTAPEVTNCMFGHFGISNGKRPPGPGYFGQWVTVRLFSADAKGGADKTSGIFGACLDRPEVTH